MHRDNNKINIVLYINIINLLILLDIPIKKSDDIKTEKNIIIIKSDVIGLTKDIEENISDN